MVDPLVLWSLSRRRKSASRVPFSLEDGSSWTGAGSSKSDRNEDEIRIHVGRSERVQAPGTAMRSMDARYSRERV